MAESHVQSGFAAINGARIYYEIAGEGPVLLMIHAGVADSRQWNGEFAHFVERYKVVRYDMRGYGKSEPVEGEYSDLADLLALLDYLGLRQPFTVMGCSMGGGLAMDFALAQPSRARALIMVDAGPGGLELDVPIPPIFGELQQAYQAGDWDRIAELETHIWFDGLDRAPEQVDPAKRQLAYDMNRTALAHEAKGLGSQVPNLDPPAAERLSELAIPVLVIVGAHDVPYVLAVADYMVEKIPTAQKVLIPDAAHLPNMDQPAEFQRVVGAFLERVLA